MIPAPAIIDTNVVVAALLGRRADSPVARILDGMIAAAFAFVMSEDLLDEYRNVLLRPRLVKAHGLGADQIDTILIEISAHAIVLTPAESSIRAPDPNDQHLWDLLGSHDHVVLVTGDALLRTPGPLQARVVTPQEFVSSWSA